MSQQNAPLSPERARPRADERRPGAPGTAVASADAASSARPYHLFADLFRGLVQGAYAVDDMHTPGLLVWILVGFVPVLGTLAAARDALYCLEAREWGALLLNLIGFLPFMKGFANIVEVTRLHRVHRVAHAAHQVAHATRHGRALNAGSRRTAALVTGVSHEGGAIVVFFGRRVAITRNGAAWPAFLVALVTAIAFPLVLGIALGVFADSARVARAIPLPLVVGGGALALLCSVGVLMLAAYARRAARALRGLPFARGVVSAGAVGLAWLGFVVTLLMVASILYVDRGAFPAL